VILRQVAGVEDVEGVGGIAATGRDGIDSNVWASAEGAGSGHASSLGDGAPISEGSVSLASRGDQSRHQHRHGVERQRLVYF